MNDEIPDDLIRDYLEGKLSPADRESFKTRLETDPGLARALADQRAEMAVSEMLIASETREQFRQWATERSHGGGFFGIKPFVWVGGIAAGLLLCFVAYRYLRPTPPEMPVVEKTPSPVSREPKDSDAAAPEEPLPSRAPASKPVLHDYPLLAAEHLPEPVLYTLRRTTADTVLSAFAWAEQAFADGDYPATLRWLTQADSAQFQSATFLRAHTLFKLRRFAEAESEFARLAESNSRRFRYSAEWGRLMCRVAVFPRGEKETRAMLESLLVQPDHPLLEQARALEKKWKE